MYCEVSLLPTSLINDESAEQIPASESQMEIQLAEQFVQEERARSVNAFNQLLEAI